MFGMHKGIHEIDGIAAAKAFVAMQFRIIGKAWRIVLMIRVRTTADMAATVIFFELEQVCDQIRIAFSKLFFGFLNLFRVYENDFTPFLIGKRLVLLTASGVT